MRRYIITLITLFWITLPSIAQLYQYIGVAEGLSDRRVFSIQKDHLGYMWFLTYAGIDKFDGKEFKHYHLNLDKLNFSSDKITLKTDSYGRIWEISTDGEAFLYNSLIDSFEKIELPQEIKQYHITFVYMTDFNEIWFCSSNHAFIYHIDLNEIQHIKLQHKHSQITCVYQAQKNTYFIGTNNGIYQSTIQKDLLILTKEITTKDTFPFPTIIYFHQSSNRLIASSEINGILIYDLTLNNTEAIYSNLKEFPISSITSLNKDQILISTSGAGVYRYTFREEKLESHFMADYSEPNKMNGNNVQALYQDEDKRIWMSVYPMGITIYDERFPGYKWIKHFIGNKNSLGSDQVYNILEDSEGDIWYATINGISLYRKKSNTWEHLLNEEEGNKQKNSTFLSLCEIKPGVIAAGGYMSGMYIIRKETMTAQITTPTSFDSLSTIDIPNKYIRAIYKDDDGIIWTGGYYYLGCTDYDNKIFKSYPIGYPITCIAEKDSTHLFIGTNNGLYKFNKKSQQASKMRMPFKSQNINTLYTHNNGDLYIGTNGSGLVVFRPNGEYKIYTHRTTSLLSNNIYSIIPQDENHLLISTERYLVRFNIKREQIYNWTEDQGLVNTHFNSKSVIHTSDGHFIFGCSNGAIQFSDTTRLPHYNKTKILIDKILIKNRNIATHPNAKEPNISTLDSLDDIDELYLKHTEDAFSIRMAAIDYDNPLHTYFQWTLQGSNNNWQHTDQDNWIKCNNLKPGNYLLRIQAVSEENHRIFEEKNLRIIVASSFWHTTWAISIYTLITILVIALITRYYHMRRKHKFAQEKIKLFIETTHDIRTPLSLIKAPIKEVLKNDKLSCKEHNNLQMAIYNSDNLYQMTSNLLNIENQVLTNKLHVSSYNLDELIQAYINYFQPLAAQKNISIQYESYCDKLDVWIDKKKMDSIFYNLLSNVIRYSLSDAAIKIRSSYNDKTWRIEISDSGIEPQHNNSYRLEKLYKGNDLTRKNNSQLGIGLSIINQLIEKHKGTLNYEGGENTKNVFTLTFPLKHRKLIKHNITDAEYEAFTSLDDLFSTIPTLILKEKCSQNNDKEKLGNILLVESNPEVRTFLTNVLTNEWDITTASNGKIALEVIKEHQPDIIISDITMAEMQCDELCSILKSNITTSHIPIVLLTPMDDKDSIIHGFKLRADHYVTKPFDLNLLRAILMNIIENRKLLQERLSQVDIVHNLKEIKNANVEQEAKFLSDVKNTIKEQINNSDFTVDTLCSLMGMSRTSLYSKVKALTNQSLSDMIRDARMQRACELLLSKKHNIMEVSDIMGFSEPKYFREVFKKYYGMSPSEYIKNKLKEDKESPQNSKNNDDE